MFEPPPLLIRMHRRNWSLGEGRSPSVHIVKSRGVTRGQSSRVTIIHSTNWVTTRSYPSRVEAQSECGSSRPRTEPHWLVRKRERHCQKSLPWQLVRLFRIGFGQRPTASALHVSVGSATAAKAGRGFPLGTTGLTLGSSLGSVAGAAGSLAANSTRSVAALADGVGLVGAEAQGPESTNQAIVVLRAGGGGVAGVSGLGADVLSEASSGARADAAHAVAGGEVARRGLRRAGGKGAQVGKALGGTQVVGDAGAVGAAGQLEGGALAAHDVAVVVAGGARLAVGGKVKGGGSAQATLVDIKAVGRGAVDVGGGGGLLSLEDGQLAGLGLANRLVLQTHVVGENVDGAAVLGGDAGREDENLARVVTAEHDELGVELERLGVVEVDIADQRIGRDLAVEISGAGGTEVASIALLGLGHGTKRLDGALLVKHGAAMLLLELTTSLALLSLDTLALGFRQHLLVLDTELAAVDVHAIHGLDDDSGVLGRLKVGKGQAPENTIVEMVVKGIGLGQMHLEHDGGQRLLADGKGNVLDDNGGGDELVGVGAGGANVGRGGVVDAEAAVGQLGAVEAAGVGLEV